MGDEPYASVTICWLLWEVAGGVSLASQALCGRYEMCIYRQMETVCSRNVPDFTVEMDTPV